MQMITTNVRFPKEEYDELKQLAFLSKKSLASIIRESTILYRKKKAVLPTTRKRLLRLIAQSAIKIDIPAVKLAKEGRKFE